MKGQVAKASEAIKAVTKFSIDVAMVDLDLGPGANGIDIAIALRDINPRIETLFLQATRTLGSLIQTRSHFPKDQGS